MYRIEVFEVLENVYVIVRKFVNSKLYMTVKGIESIKYMLNVRESSTQPSQETILPELINGLTITVSNLVNIMLVKVGPNREPIEAPWVIVISIE